MTIESRELFELCRRVYEATVWDDTRDYYHEKDSFNFDTRSFERNGEWTVVERRRAPYDIPLYTSDYLLEKLPNVQNSNEISYFLQVEKQSINLYIAGYTDVDGLGLPKCVRSADTPLKALLRLTLKLHEEKIL